jgi:hypothetical protein
MAADVNPFGVVLRLALGGAVITGALLFAAQALHKQEVAKPEAKVEKIGPTMSVQPKPPSPTVQAIEVPTLPPVQSVAPAPPAAASVVSVPAAPALLPAAPSPQASQTAPRAAPQVQAAAQETLSPAGDSETPRARTRSGASGCTNYKTYNPQTQTYRGFDGKTYDCR